MSDTWQDHFFAVGRDTFIKACDLGMNPAVSFLIMACGTGPAQKNTAWSATAVEKYAGIGWNRANEAIKTLTKKKLAKRTDDGTNKRRPRYELQVKGDLIWLPKSIVSGVGNAVGPIKKLRQTQDVMTLRLFIELYHAQNLRDDGGISRDVTYQTYERHEFGGRAEFTVWAFDDPDAQTVAWSDVTLPHRRSTLTDAEKAAGKNPGIDFFDRWATLKNLELVQWSLCLFEGEDGEPIHAIEDNDMHEAIYSAACGLLSQGQVDASEYHDYLIPVHNHLKAVQLFGIARLKYRPKTSATAAWWAKHNRQRLEYLEHYRGIANKHSTAEAA